jgi:hypothetical protein
MSQLEALGLTIAIEVVVALAILLGARWLPRAELARAGAIVAAASLLSHPLAWQANTVWLRRLPFAERAAVIEIAVALIETVVLAFGLRIGWRRAAVIAVIANAVSFALGLWLTRWW